MDLNLTDRLNEKEQNELKRRAFSAMEQMFLEGLSVGRELNREELHYETEKYIQDKILFLSNYFMNDKVWSEQPPANYREMKIIPELDKSASSLEVCDGQEISDFENPESTIDSHSDEEKPEWAKKARPFK